MTKRFEDFGIKGVKYNGTNRQSVHCPRCKGTARTNLTVWAIDQNWSCSVCGWKGTLKQSEREVFKPIQPKAAFTKLVQDDADWLKSRGITRAVAERNHLSRTAMWFPQVEGTRNAVAFPYYVGDAIVAVKYRTPDKLFTQEKGAERSFYKINDARGASEVIICEGELDALSFEVAGMNHAISVPDGAPSPTAVNLDTKLEFLERSRSLLSHVERFYLACDNDEPGRKLTDELARRLGRKKCRIVSYPSGCKDANDVLVKHGVELLKSCITKAEAYPIAGAVLPESRFAHLDDIYQYGHPDGAKTINWPRFDTHLQFFVGQLTVITGISQHGKTAWTDNLAVNLHESSGWKTAFFTPENDPIEVHMERLASIISGKAINPAYNNHANQQEFEAAKEFIRRAFFYIYPPQSEFTLDNIIDIAEYYVASKGVKMIVIDPWNSIIHRKEDRYQSDTDYIAEALNKIKYASRNIGFHTLLIAHPRKMARRGSGSESAILANYEEPTLYDISGSANWFNVPDNGLIIYRNRLDEHTSETHIIIEKIKHKYIGRTGRILQKMDVSCDRFHELNGQIPQKTQVKSYDETY